MSITSRVTDLATSVRTKINAMMPRLLATGGTAGQVYKRIGSSHGWADESGGGGSSDPLLLPTDFDDTLPDLPATGLVVFTRSRAGRRRLCTLSPSGLDTSLQSLLATNKVREWSASGNSTTAFVRNLTAVVQGTAAAVNVASSNLFQSVSRIRYSTLAQASSAAGLRHNLPQFFRGDGTTGPGGFEIIQRFGIAQHQGGMRAFCGAYGSGSGIGGTVTSANLLNAVGVGFDSGDANWSIMHNDSTGAATKIGLGSEFPAMSSSEDLYEVRVFTPPRGTSYFVSLTNLTTGITAEAEITTNMPVPGLLMGEQLWISTGAGTTIASIDIVSRYVETDY